MPSNTKTWEMIHAERAALVRTLDGLSPEEWESPSLCDGWTVKLVAAHVLSGAEQTGPWFAKGIVANGFRFNTMIDRDAGRLGQLEPLEIVERLAARTSTTNHPPAPVMAMLGEVVVHGEDLRQPLGLKSAPSAEATAACLAMYRAGELPGGGQEADRGSAARRHRCGLGSWCRTQGAGAGIGDPAVDDRSASRGGRPGRRRRRPAQGPPTGLTARPIRRRS